MAGSRGVLLAIDIGGTKIALGLMAGTSVAPYDVLRFATPPSAADALATLVHHCRHLTTGKEVTGVGVSFGGHVRGTRLHSLHVPGWETVDLAETLANAVNAPVFILNDAEAGALCEFQARQTRLGATSSLFYLTVSTGVGGAIVIDGLPHSGARGLAGEVGHLPMGGTDVCSCGGLGHLESMASGPAIARRARYEVERASSLNSLLRSVDSIDARAVSGAALRGDALARRILSEAGRRVGEALATVALVLDPSVICVGGGVAQSGPSFWDALASAVRGNPLLDVVVERAAHRSDSALVGAGLYAGISASAARASEVT